MVRERWSGDEVEVPPRAGFNEAREGSFGGTGAGSPVTLELAKCSLRRSGLAMPTACGSFRTPSLRNVAVRESFMHNGRFRKLRDVVAFDATRSTNPERCVLGLLA